MVNDNYFNYKVCICKLFSNVCLFVDIEKILFTNQIADQVKKSFLTVCMMRVITFFLREIHTYLILKPDSAVELGARTFTTVFTTSCWFIAEVPECQKSW